MRERPAMMFDDIFFAGALTFGLATLLTVGVALYIWRDSYSDR